MPKSDLFRELLARLTELRKHFLPSKFSPTGTYRERNYDRARAYRLLVHAEIEHYLERIAERAVLDCIKNWRADKTASDIIICLLASYHSGWGDDSENSEALPITSKNNIKAGVDKVIQNTLDQYMHILRTNHGIREENLKNIFIPIGIRFVDLDPTWLIDITSFGKDRGEVAHRSNKAQQAIDPKTEYERVKVLIIGLGELDQLVQSALA